ncbi:MAG: hypothetical protein QHH05_06115 [Syntrophomonadaceae bacterium]|nr:hypothetical protein [Syntrophomonadaceae bacterium]MDH7498003.1 hypothetical protein [Syntrophomonadaceae bacterium]
MGREHSQNGNGAGGLRMKVRFDYRGTRAGRLFFGGRNVEQMAEAAREQQVALLRNVPLQGIRILDIDMSADVYVVTDEFSNQPLGFAPVTVTFAADSLDDCVRFIAREEFRTVQVLEPAELVLAGSEVERLLFRINEEFREFKSYLERKLEKS